MSVTKDVRIAARSFLGIGVGSGRLVPMNAPCTAVLGCVRRFVHPVAALAPLCLAASIATAETLTIGGMSFSDEPGGWVNELSGVEFASRDEHNYLKMREGEYDIIVVSPRISDQREGPPLMLLIVGLGLSFLLIGCLLIRTIAETLKNITAESHINVPPARKLSIPNLFG